MSNGSELNYWGRMTGFSGHPSGLEALPTKALIELLGSGIGRYIRDFAGRSPGCVLPCRVPSRVSLKTVCDDLRGVLDPRGRGLATLDARGVKGATQLEVMDAFRNVLFPLLDRVDVKVIVIRVERGGFYRHILSYLRAKARAFGLLIVLVSDAAQNNGRPNVRSRCSVTPLFSVEWGMFPTYDRDFAEVACDVLEPDWLRRPAFVVDCATHFAHGSVAVLAVALRILRVAQCSSKEEFTPKDAYDCLDALSDPKSLANAAGSHQKPAPASFRDRQESALHRRAVCEAARIDGDYLWNSHRIADGADSNDEEEVLSPLIDGVASHKQRDADDEAWMDQ
jgi:hypothetical protein